MLTTAIATSQMPVQGDSSTASAGDKVTMHCKIQPLTRFLNWKTQSSIDKFDDASGNYTQTVQVNGKTVSTLSTSDGHAQGWGSAVECAKDNCGTVGAHCKTLVIPCPVMEFQANVSFNAAWVDTKITLNSADPDYIKTMAKGDGVTGDMKTTDGGKTWTVGTIAIPQHSFGSS